MAGWMILVVAVIYFGTSIDLMMKGQFGLGLTFFFYALSNIGLYLVSIGK